MKAFIRAEIVPLILASITGLVLAAIVINVLIPMGLLWKPKPPEPPVHHMVSLIHYDDEMVCFIDNNDPPGTYRHMPTAEFKRQHVPEGWAVVRVPEEDSGLCVIKGLSRPFGDNPGYGLFPVAKYRQLLSKSAD